MTTVVVTKKSGFVCIAADTLATYGDMRESADLIRNSDKLVQIGDAWVAPTGPASAQLVLKHYVAGYDELPALEDIDSIFESSPPSNGRCATTTSSKARKTLATTSSRCGWS